MTGLIIFLISGILLVWLVARKKPPVKIEVVLPQNIDELLEENIAYYRSLPSEKQSLFVDKVKDFLSYVNIKGVNTTVNELDKLMVACSAVIPIFGFGNWRYFNLTDVLLYDGAFNAQKFSTIGEDTHTLGMVGTGAMEGMMILSKHALQQGFLNETDKSNTGIHEFVHLLDKADGETDGIPEQLLSKQYTIPWINLMNEKIAVIQKGSSDINPYGAVSKTEFFAVAAEYFFERPDLFKTKHPQLFALMEKAFIQQPATK
jgi:MtfA peptidase